MFADEPILRVNAPLPEAQLAETRLLNILHFETLIASKAARIVLAAEGKQLVDFGMRRAHGAEAGLLAARASYIAGFDGTATVQAGADFGIPLFGTMAHSFIQAHVEEQVAFERFARSLRRGVVLLIDTYDTQAAARSVVELAGRLAADGISIAGVRIDSGELGPESTRVREILDDGGLREMKIFVSGGLDELQIARLLAGGAPIDGFGVGTSLTTSSDAPGLDCAYKLQEYEGRLTRKRSPGKATWPGRKQVWRRYTADGRFAGDVVGLQAERHPGEPLLRAVMRSGRMIDEPERMSAMRRRARAELTALPERLRKLEPAPYEVEISLALREAAATFDRRGSSSGAPP